MILAIRWLYGWLYNCYTDGYTIVIQLLYGFAFGGIAKAHLKAGYFRRAIFLSIVLFLMNGFSFLVSDLGNHQ